MLPESHSRGVDDVNDVGGGMWGQRGACHTAARRVMDAAALACCVGQGCADPMALRHSTGSFLQVALPLSFLRISSCLTLSLTYTATRHSVLRIPRSIINSLLLSAPLITQFRAYPQLQSQHPPGHRFTIKPRPWPPEGLSTISTSGRQRNQIHPKRKNEREPRNYSPPIFDSPNNIWPPCPLETVHDGCFTSKRSSGVS